MPEIGAYEAKTHLSEILERVRKGEYFTITKHGRRSLSCARPWVKGWRKGKPLWRA